MDSTVAKDPLFEQVSINDSISNADREEAFSRIQRRIDWRLLPALSLIYGASLMDRTNTANAAVGGMLVDLKMVTGIGYNVVTLSFFLSNVLAQPFMAVLCRKLGPKIFLSSICIAWGIVIIGLGFVHSWVVQVPLRLLLGIFEAGFGPASIYLLSTWYTRFDVGRRFSVFYMSGCLLAALSGVLSAGLTRLNGREGLAGWRWIFILEGVITCAVGLLAFFLLINFPDVELRRPTSWFLRHEEVKAVIRRIDADSGDVGVEPFELRKFLQPAKRVEIWCFASAFLLATTISYSFAFFLPILLHQTLKFSVIKSQCLGTPPYIFAALYMFTGSWISDRLQKRALVILFNSLVSIIGLPIMGFHHQPYIRYFGLFLAVAGVNANIPALMAWQSNNVRGQWQRAFSSTTLTIFASLGGIAGSLIFRSQDKPGYVPGLSTCLACAVILSLLTVGLALYFSHCNSRADQGKLIIHGIEGFRYTI